MEKYFHFDRNKSLQELKKENFGAINFESHLVITYEELMTKVIGSFKVEELRIMIGQKIGLDYLIPLALETLEDNIFAEGDIYSGDLLDAVLRVDKNFWRKNHIYKKDLENILEKNINNLKYKQDSFYQKFI